MSRRPPVQPCGTRAAFARGCRCDDCAQASRDYHHHQRLGGEREPKSPVGPAPPGPWVDRAACRGSDPDVFFPVRGVKNVDHLRTICAGCPVRPDCLAWALGAYSDRNDHGFYGGLTARERRRLRAAS